MPTRSETGMPAMAIHPRKALRFFRCSFSRSRLGLEPADDRPFIPTLGSPPEQFHAFEAIGKPEVEVDKTEEGKDQQEPGPERHDRMDLQGNHQLPEELRPFQVVDEAEKPEDQGKGCDVRPDPGDVLIFSLADRNRRGRIWQRRRRLPRRQTGKPPPSSSRK